MYHQYFKILWILKDLISLMISSKWEDQMLIGKNKNKDNKMIEENSILHMHHQKNNKNLF